jgi:hypothetical protein
MKTVKCLLCGKTLPVTRKNKPRQHLSTKGKTCAGSGQDADKYHNRLRKAGEN